MIATVKPVLSRHTNRRRKISFQDRLSLNAGQKYCRMLQESILQYFQPSLSYHLSLRPLFCLFLSGGLRQVLLYMDHTVRKLVFVVCVQQRHRQAWKSTKSDQELAMIHCLERMRAMCNIQNFPLELRKYIFMLQTPRTSLNVYM